MINDIKHKLSQAGQVAVLAAATFSGYSEAMEPVSSSLKQAKDIPAKILKAAENKGILAIEDIKQIPGTDNWIACKGDSCISLGTASAKPAVKAETDTQISGLRRGDALVINRYGEVVRSYAINFSSSTSSAKIPKLGEFKKQADGSFTFTIESGVEARISAKNKKEVIDTLPKYVKEASNIVRTKDLALVKDYVDKHPEQAFLVIVTVPALCEPCRSFETILPTILKDPSLKNQNLKVFILEYFNFEDPQREIVGSAGNFPSVLTFGGAKFSIEIKSQPEAAVVGDARGHSDRELLEPIQNTFNRPLRELIRGSVGRKELPRLLPRLFHSN
jgi:hypothetical protein